MKKELTYWKQKQEFISWKQKLVSWIILFGLLGVLSLVIAGCGSTNTSRWDSSNAQVKTVGHQLNNTILSVISDAAVGGTTGSAINSHMDKQASELHSRLKGVKVIRFAEGILVTIDSRLLFDEDSNTLQSTKGMLRDFARVLQKHAYTNIIIEGHTDDVGEEIYNQSLSEERAHQIETYLVRKGINDLRVKTRGYGERQPIAPNDTEAGRQMNCRIEIGLYANDQFRKSVSKADETYTALKR